MLDLKICRIQMGLTQTEMAKAMGMPLRSYQDIEGGKNPVRPIHEKAAWWVMVEHAANTAGYGALPFEIGEVARRAAASGRGK